MFIHARVQNKLFLPLGWELCSWVDEVLPCVNIWAFREERPQSHGRKAESLPRKNWSLTTPKRAAVWYRSNWREIRHWKQRERNYVLQVWAKQVIVLPCWWSSQGKFIANEQALPPYPASPLHSFWLQLQNRGVILRWSQTLYSLRAWNTEVSK